MLWPALLTRISTQPIASSASRQTLFTSISWLRSALKLTARRPLPPAIQLAAAAPLDWSRSTIMISAPWHASPQAMARPSPEPPPVISATRPVRSCNARTASACGRFVLDSVAGTAATHVITGRGHEACVVGEEEPDDVCDFIGSCGASHRDAGNRIAPEPIGHLVLHAGVLDQGRRDAVDPYAEPRHLVAPSCAGPQFACRQTQPGHSRCRRDRSRRRESPRSA